MEIKNITDIEKDTLLYPIGTICTYVDELDPDNSVTCTIKYIEKDEEIEGIWYYYLIANLESLNDKMDPRFPWPYFNIVHHADPKLIPIAQATQM